MPVSETLPGPEKVPYGAQLVEMSSNGKDIFVISDLHIAAGLNSNRNYDGTENFFADYSFVRFLHHLEKKITPNRKGLLIINGDLVDFLRIKNIPVTSQDFENWASILDAIGRPLPIDQLKTSISPKEIKYGLRTDDYKSVWKLSVCAGGHPQFFDQLAAWVEKGNELVITKGNHDLEWYWKPVRDYFRYLLAQRIAVRQNGDPESVLKKIIHPAVHFVDNRLILDRQIAIEHGHKYERFTTVDGPPVLKGDTQLNLPFGSFFNRYLINRIELAYPYIDDVRPRQNILSLLLRERFPLAIQLLFNYIPFVILVIPKKQYAYAFKYLFQFLLIVVLPLLVTAFALYKGFHGIPKVDSASGAGSSFWTPVLSELKNLLFLSLSYFIGRLFAFLQLSSPSSLFPNAKDIFDQNPALKLVTFGHTHDPEQVFVDSVSSGAKRYCNTGTWIPVFEMDAADVRLDRTFTFLHIERNSSGDIKLPDLYRWNDDAAREDALILIDKK